MVETIANFCCQNNKIIEVNKLYHQSNIVICSFISINSSFSEWVFSNMTVAIGNLPLRRTHVVLIFFFYFYLINSRIAKKETKEYYSLFDIKRKQIKQKQDS
jgi:hypothetical protein